MSDGTHHNPELDLPGRSREMHGLSTAYKHRVHERRAVGSQICVLNSITGRHVTSVEGDGKRLRVFVHRRIPLGGMLVWEDGNLARFTGHNGWRTGRQGGVSGGLGTVNGRMEGHLVYAELGSESARRVEELRGVEGVGDVSAGICTQAVWSNGPAMRAM
jgi:hypothetical protein